MQTDPSAIATPTRRTVLAGLAAPFMAPALPRPALWAQAADRSAEVLPIGPGKQYPSITAAGERLAKKWDPYSSPPNHDPVHLIVSPGPPGYYADDFGSYSKRWPGNNHGGWPPYHCILSGPAIIEGEPGKPAPDLVCSDGGDGVLYYQKGAFITGGFDATFRRLNFQGFRRKDGYGNYAAVRLETLENHVKQAGNFLFEDVRIAGCDDGILGGSPGQTVTLRRCEFTQNGGGAGRTHNVYIGEVDLLTVEDVLSTRSIIGHLLKSRAAKTVIRRTRLFTGDGTTSACLDVPDGGILEIDGLICEKGADSDASWVIHYAGENQDAGGMFFYADSRVTIRDLTMVSAQALARHPSWPVVGFANESGNGEAHSGKGSRLITPDASGVRAYGIAPDKVGLPGAEILKAAPELDWASPVRA